MPQILTEPEIAALLAEGKSISTAQIARLKHPRRKKAIVGLGARVIVRGAKGTPFVITVRQSIKKPMDFSLILALALPRRKQLNLIRCNGHHGEHRNHLEKMKIPANTCHIHRITERYQHFPTAAPETFAWPTPAYNCLQTAVEFFCTSFGIYRDGDRMDGGLFRDQE